jgi:hypothetical protein
MLQCQLLETPVSLSSRLSLQPEVGNSGEEAAHSQQDRNI